MKKIISILLALVLCVGVLPVEARAAAADTVTPGTETYTTRLDFTNVGDSEDQTAAEGQGYKWEGNAGSGYKLTLNGIKINVPANAPMPAQFQSNARRAGIYVPTDGAVTIELVGQNSITAEDGDAIYCDGGQGITVQGTGSLAAVTSGEIVTNRTKGDVIIKDVTIQANASGCGFVTRGDGNIVFENAKISIDSQGTNSPVIYTQDTGCITIKDSVVDVSCVKHPTYGGSHAICAMKDITITGGTVTASTDESGCAAIAAMQDLTINGGAKVTAKGSGNPTGFGIYAKRSMTLSQSVIMAEGTTAAVRYNGQLTLDGIGVLEPSGGKAGANAILNGDDSNALSATLASNIPVLSIDPITFTYTGAPVPASAITGTATVLGQAVKGTWAFAENQDLTTVANSGTKDVIFTPASDEYAEATGTVVVTINKATPTGAPKYTAITASGKTLADAGLTTEGSTFNTDGTISWDLPDDTAVTANTEYAWTFTPTDAANYNVLTGKIKLWAQSSGGSSGGTTIPPKQPVTTDTTQNTTQTTATPTATTQGDKTTATVTTSMGNEIVKQAKENDSQTVVIAPKTGSATKTEVSIPAATVGQIGQETSASLTVSTSVADVTIPNGGLGSLASAGGTVTVTAQQTGDSVELLVTAGGEVVESIPGGITLTVPAKDTTPGTVAMLVREDGTREVVRKSVADEKSVTIPLDGSAKLVIVDNSKTFDDVPADSWAADAVAFASAHELFNGTAPGQFSPNTAMSRGMLAVVLHNLESNPEQALTGVFGDVDGTQWYAEGVAWAAEKGIVSGYGNGQFGPNDPITREQLATMLWRYAGEPKPTGTTLDFADADKASGYAKAALLWAAEKGIINGKGNGVLDPKGPATRAQVAQILKNFMK